MQEELLVLRKTLTKLLNKGFIWVSNSPATALVLFVKQLSGKLQFYVDYQALNILEWASPSMVKGVQAFLGFANFY
jgi:hypothetical protein